MTSFEIGGKRVGGDAPVYFVAELSANHGQSLEKALQTVEAAAEAGADAIKLQTYTPDTLTIKSDDPRFIVNTRNAWAGRTLYDLYSEAMTPWEWHKPIMEAAASFGLACFSTPFDPTASYFLDQLGVPAFKIASFEVIDLPLIEATARLGKPMIISTGMASLAEIEAALTTCFQAGNHQVALLRCVSSYPATPEAMDLRSLDVLRGFGTVLGFSDHTRDDVAALTAVSLGARMIEKHLIVDRAWGGPDSFFSLSPSEFKQLVKNVRAFEAALGHPRFGPSQEEASSFPFRRSLFVARDVHAGGLLTCDDVRSIRPSNGLSPRHLPEVLGCVATRPLRAAEPLAWDMVGPLPPSADEVVLRPAHVDDASRLLEWRNDAETRAHSRNKSEIGAAEHEHWLRASLNSSDRALLVAEVAGKPVGQLRLDRAGKMTAEVSVTLAPSARGRGLAVTLLRALEPIGRGLGYATFVAEIREENVRSVRVFKDAGYYSFALRERAYGRGWSCERRLRRFGP